MTDIQKFAAEHDCGGGLPLLHRDGSVTVRVLVLNTITREKHVDEVRCFTWREVRDALGY